MTKRQRLAVVTGGSSGIGLATVKRLLGADFKVAFFGQNADHVRDAAGALKEQFGEDRYLAACVDIRSTTAVTQFFAELEGHWGAPDTLISNAGISPKGLGGGTTFANLTLEEWNDVMAVNVTGAMLCCQSVLSTMMARRFGRVILIGSIAGRTVPRVAGTAYTVSKAALAGLARSLLGTCAGTGVTINLVAPGRVLTNMTGLPDSPLNRAALARIPSGRLGEPADIAETIAFLVSESAGFVNGAVIDVNGGEFAPL